MVNEDNNIPNTDNEDDIPVDDSALQSSDMNLPGDPIQNKQPVFKPKKSFWQKIKNPFIAVTVVALLAGIGFGVYKVAIKNNTNNPVPPTTDSATQQSDQKQVSTGEASELNETYTSDSLRLNFKYPSDWKVNEVDRGIRVESPTFTFTSKDKGEVEGNFRLYIRKGARSSDGKYLGDGYAIAPSTKLTYADPASGQRDSTWLTDFGVKTTNNFAYFVVQGNFELKKGATLGPSFAKEADAYLIAGGYSNPDLTDDIETVLTPIDGNYNQTPQYKTAVAIVQSLQLR